MNLIKKLSRWQQENLISAYQQEAILDYEKRSGRPKFFISVILLSVFCIGLGLIALISANWEEIPAWSKLGTDILLLSATAGAIYFFAQNGKRHWLEGGLLFYALLIIGSIGLIAQVYQLQSDDLRAYFLWCVLTIPLLLMTQKIVLPLIWLPIFFISGISLLENYDWYHNILKYFEQNYPFACGILFFIILSYLWLFFSRSLKLRPLAAAATVYLWVVGASLMVYFDFACAHGHSSLAQKANIFYISVAIFVLSCGLAILSRIWQHSFVLPGLIVVLWLFSLVEAIAGWNGLAADILGLLSTLTVLGLTLVYAWYHNQVKLMNWAVALIAVRFFIVFLQKFGSLLDTGLGLIVIGTVFLLLAIGVKKIIVYNNKELSHE